MNPFTRHDHLSPVKQTPVYTLDSYPGSFTETDDTSETNSGTSVTSDESSEETSQQSFGMAASWHPHVRDTLQSPYGQFSVSSSGYGSRTTSQSTPSRDHTNTIPISEAPSGSRLAADSEESQDDSNSHSNSAEFSPATVSLEIELMTALQKYYEDPPEVTAPKDETYEIQSNKIANIEARCAEFKKEMDVYKQQQYPTPSRHPRTVSSV